MILKFLLVTHTILITPYTIHRICCHSTHHCCWLLLVLPVLLLNQQYPVTSFSLSTHWGWQFALLQPHNGTSRIGYTSIVQEAQLNGVCCMYYSWNYAGNKSHCISVRKQVSRGSMQQHHWEVNTYLRRSFKFHFFFHSKYSLFLLLWKYRKITWIRSQVIWEGQFIIYRR